MCKLYVSQCSQNKLDYKIKNYSGIIVLTEFFEGAKMAKYLSIVVFMLVIQVWAMDDNEQDMNQAVQDTQQVLKNKSERKKIIQKDSKAKSVDDNVKQLTGGDEKAQEDIYAVAAELVPYLQKMANNDPNKMMELLAEAQKDPKKFSERWPPEQRAKLKAITERIQKQQEKKP